MMRRLPILLLLAFSSVALPAGQDRRSTGTSAVVFVVDGTEVASLAGYEGGGIRADVIASPGGGGKKNIGSYRVEDLVVSLPIPLHPQLGQWIQGALNGQPSRKNVAMVHLDALRKPLQTFDFRDAVIARIAFPAFDASSRDSAAITLALRAESVTQRAGGIEFKPAETAARRSVAVSAFRLGVAGLEGRGVMRIDPITLSMKETVDAVGDQRDMLRTPGVLEIAPFAVTLAAAQADSWVAWAEDFIVKGNCADASEKTGTLDLLAADLKTSEMTLKFDHVGIFRLKRVAGPVERVEAGLYAETLTLGGPGEAAAGTATPSTSPPPASPTPSPTPTPSPSASPAGDAADQGARDPAAFPRPEGAVRQSFSSSRQKARCEERAEYVVKEQVGKVEERYAKAIQAAGWEETSRSESGDIKKGDYCADLRYKKEGGSGIVYLYAKGETTLITLNIVTDLSLR